MKTDTRQKIIEITRGGSGVRPIELVKKLGLSPQAIHRHLKWLVLAGVIEARNRGPQTRYCVAGSPEIERALHWSTSKTTPKDEPDLICQTRDAFAARLNRLDVSHKLKEPDLALATAVAGEIGNNCFDHNLGNWRDVPGCWFETQTTGGRLWICISDRGQGVLRSLTRVDPTILNDQTALTTAFEKSLSGRYPENRGNGLKFVKNVIVGGEGRGLACRSGTGLVDYGPLGRECRAQLSRILINPVGTLTLVLWSLK